MNTMTNIDVCNQALGAIGQGRTIKALDSSSPESEACRRLYPQALNYCLNAANWSFARRDEIITDKELLEDVVALPYGYSYSIPEDVMRILLVTETHAGSIIDTLRNKESIQFNIRNYDGKKILVTDHEPEFAIQYIAYIDDISVCDPTFIEGLIYILASKLAGALIKGTSGIQIAQTLFSTGLSNLQIAAGFDAQQNATNLEHVRESRFIAARR